MIYNPKANNGFTLIELMVVVTIIGILSAIAIPSYQNYTQRTEMVDALSMASEIKAYVTDYHKQQLAFPINNETAGVPAPELLINNRVTSTAVESGAIHITLGNKISKPQQGKVLTFRPAVVIGSPASPISWLCGYDEPVKGMQAVGENKTNIDNNFLPSICRAAVVSH